MPEVFSGHDKAFLTQPRIQASLFGLLAAVKGCAKKGVLLVLARDGGLAGGWVLSAPLPRGAAPSPGRWAPASLSPPRHSHSSLLLFNSFSKDRRIKSVYPEDQLCQHFCENLPKAKRS